MRLRREQQRRFGFSFETEVLWKSSGRGAEGFFLAV
eukprot:COSAG05_NODE_24211_length_253_cov_0.662338_1_plen_35_part_01